MALWAGFALAASVLCTHLVRRFALRRNIVDSPEQAPERKIHRVPTPLLGGLGAYGAFLITIVLITLVQPQLLFGGYLHPKHVGGILLGGLLLMIGGACDDIRPRSPKSQILWPMIAAALIVASGVGIEYLSNPFGEPFRLDQWRVTVFTLFDLPYQLILVADLFAWGWLMLSMYTTKFLDGLDGLVSGVSVIGMVILFLLSIGSRVGQPETGLLALLGAATFLGFLFFNFHPAKIFLGEGGSLWAGFLLGSLAILSGGKIATALLILGIPILDVLWVVGRRLLTRPTALALADRKHLHYRLLDVGLSHRQAVLVLYVCSAIFGSATLFTEGASKFFVLLCVGVVMVLLGVMLVIRSRRRQPTVDKLPHPPYTA